MKGELRGFVFPGFLQNFFILSEASRAILPGSANLTFDFTDAASTQV